MKLILNNNDLNEALYGVSNLGFVPTMGSLHKGHISLIKKSIKQCDKTIVSIFVNPTQFNNQSDYSKYPKNIKLDLSILKKLNVNYVYAPNKREIYNWKRKSKIRLHKRDKVLCAKYRKGHFEGVIDVVDRLLKLIKPKKVFMGEKDFQQIFLIKKYLKKYYKSNIITCKTVRDKNKLALSSRNFLLKKNDLINAGNIAKNLINFKKKLAGKNNIKKIIRKQKKELNEIFNISIEYLDLRHVSNLKNSNKIKNAKIFIAYYLNKVRLIDNF